MLLVLLECFDLLLNVCYLTFIAEHDLDLSNKFISILRIFLVFHLVKFLLYIYLCNTLFKLD